MTLPAMRALVRRDLKDEDATNYRFTNDEIDRAISRAVQEFSVHVPREMKSTLPTTSGSRNIDISTLTERVSVDAVEYPVDKHPKVFRKFWLYQDTLVIGQPYDPTQGDTVPDGSNCYIYWGKLHTLDASTSTIPTQHEWLIALGAAGYAILSQSQYTTEAVTPGGRDADRDYAFWSRDALRQFKFELKRISKHRKLKTTSLRTECGNLYD